MLSISKHPRIQENLKAELVEIALRKNHCHFSLNDLDSLVYLDAVIEEVFRISPSIDATYRTLLARDRQH